MNVKRPTHRHSKMYPLCFASPTALVTNRNKLQMRATRRPHISMSDRQPAPLLTRRAALAGLAIAAAAGAAAAARVRPAAAESMLEMDVRANVTALLDVRAHARALRAELEAGGDAPLPADEAEPLARAVAVWGAPGVQALQRIASSPVDVGPGLGPLAAVLPVHLQELAEERRKGSRVGCVREIDEVLETLDNALLMPGLARFVQGRRWNGREWAETKL
jgi:hypothetical protein